MKKMIVFLMICVGILSFGHARENSYALVNVTFINYTLMDVKVYQLSPNGGEIFKADLRCGDYQEIRMPSNMQWNVKTANNNAVLMTGTVGNRSQEIDVEFRSGNSGSSVSVNFYNGASGTAVIYWVDQSGNERQKGSLSANQNQSFQTSESSAWIFKTASGAILDTYVANRQGSQSFTISGEGMPVGSREAVAVNPQAVDPQPSQPPVGPESGSTPHQSEMIPVGQLGVGFDAVYTDPENFTQNSVKNGSYTPPRVFELTPDANKAINLSKSSNLEVKKYLPVGVRGDELGIFKNNEKSGWIKSAEEFQNSYGNSFGGSVGLPGIASFSGSAAFNNVEATTSNNENIYITRDWSYQGHRLSLNMNYPHKLSAEFRNDVSRLGSDINQYTRFITKWGTHFSSENLVGAKCSYRFKYSKSAYGSRNESESEFRVGVEGQVQAIELGLEYGHSSGQISDIKEEIGEQNVEFISYGASGKQNYGEWADDAKHTRITIDVKLRSYLELFNSGWFPNDTGINNKRSMLQQALTQYFNRHGSKSITNGDNFFKRQPKTFKVELTELHVKRGHDLETRHYGGELYIGLYDQYKRQLKSSKFMNLNGDNWLDWGKWKGNTLNLKGGQRYPYSVSFTQTLQPDQIAGAFVTITGSMTETWHWGSDSGKHTMGSRSPHDKTGKIELDKLKKGETKTAIATYRKNKDGEMDQVDYHFKVTRIQ